MAGLDSESESAIVDLSGMTLVELAMLDDEMITAVSRCVSDLSGRLWSVDGHALGLDE